MLAHASLVLVLAAAPGHVVELPSGLKMYVERHGATGPPLLLLHGGASSIAGTWGALLPRLAKSRVVVAPEQQGHGHTADLERPLSYEQMAEDTAAMLKLEQLGPVDVLGWSDGGIVALLLARAHPELVRRVVVTGANWRADGLKPELLKWLATSKADDWPSKKTYPVPAHWPVFAEKLRRLWTDWSRPLEDLDAVKRPVLVMAGDRDIVTLEHTLAMHRHLAGSALAILPATGHETIRARPEWVRAQAEAWFAGEPP
ncbi:MAG: alpha/beta hydrolase [Myxococcota bacterium]